MIKPGTLCIIKIAPHDDSILGLPVTFVRYGIASGLISSNDFLPDDCTVLDGKKPSTYVAAWLMPIQGDPDTILQFECEQEHV